MDLILTELITVEYDQCINVDIEGDIDSPEFKELLQKKLDLGEYNITRDEIIWDTMTSIQKPKVYTLDYETQIL